MTDTAASLDTVAALYERQCASEPIHLLGGVQPHGFMLVVDLASGRIVQVSAGVTRHWPGIADAETLLGTPLQDWAHRVADPGQPDPPQPSLLESLRSLPLEAPALLPLALRDLAAHDNTSAPALPGFECMGHAVAGCAVLEWIAINPLPPGGQPGVAEIQRLSSVLRSLRGARHLAAYLDDCVVQMQAVSGYDRVMLYRFLPDWSGDIVAEHTGPGFTPKYRGLRFPATDIPPQARRLYERNTLRVLNDTAADADPLVPPLLPGGQPLDQSFCLLRSLSEVHKLYLRNMGVRATLVISLMVEGRLWGLLTCHHHQPWVPPHDTRNFMRWSCELMANAIGTRIDDLSRLERQQQAQAHADTQAALAAELERGGDLGAAVAAQSASLCQAFGATAWGMQVGHLAHVSSNHTASATGSDPAAATALLAQVAQLAGQLAPGAVLQDSRLGQKTPPALPSAPQAAGILVARLPAGQDGLCFFLRPEVQTEVDWAGEPDKLTLVTGDGEPRLEPRRSFALWKQTHAGCASAWAATDETAAASLAAVLAGAYKSQLNRALQQELDWRVQHDDLTGLFNRSVIERELALRLHGGSTKLALFLIDIDHFKRINDSLGHEVGDQVLVEAARRFAATTRGADLTIRMGGDEFLLIATMQAADPPSDHAALDNFAQRLHAAFAADFRGQGWTQRVRISVGVAVSPDHGNDAVTLIRHADMALYEAKRQGRSRSAVFDSAIESRIQQASDMEAEIDRALSQDELRLHYQPKVDLLTHRVVGMEALVRWQHPRRGLLGPDQFITLAETTGQIDGIGRWVIGEAAAQLARWRSEGKGVWPVAINVSFVQIANGSLLTDIRAACARWQMPFEWLELELTETVAMEDSPQSTALLNTVRALGMKVSLDDFGTGYSSLAHVRQLPLDCLKIDRSFVGSLEADPQSVVVTRGVIGMAHGLHLTTVAEGVETLAQLRWLIDHRCDIGQGYFFSRPVPASQVPQAVLAIERAAWE
jgi:diguanylate cyclase (GGDEF)-like protein